MQNLITWPYVLRRGHSPDPAHGACAMDAINWLVHGRHGDTMECACPVITSYVIPGNDEMPDNIRQRLLPYLHRIAGSRSEAHQEARIRILQLAAIRVFAPRALDAARLSEHAAMLRNLPDDVDMTRVALAAEAASRAAALVAVEAMPHAASRAALVAEEAIGCAWAAWESWAEAEAQAARAVMAASMAQAWDDYFVVLDQVLSAGPQGEPWSADVVSTGMTLFRAAGGQAETVL